LLNKAGSLSLPKGKKRKKLLDRLKLCWLMQNFVYFLYTIYSTLSDGFSATGLIDSQDMNAAFRVLLAPGRRQTDISESKLLQAGGDS